MVKWGGIAPWAGATTARRRGQTVEQSAHSRARVPGRPPRPARHSLRDQVLSALREALLDGRLRPGAVYSAPALADRFGVSATPVREAMQQLVREGAVHVARNRGFRVAEVSARDQRELGEVRALIEVPILLRLAGRLPAERWNALRPLAEATAEAAARGDRGAYAEADRAFHSALLEPYGNAQLVLVAEDLHRRTQCPPSAAAHLAVASADATLSAGAAEHAAILDALSAGDLPTVEALLRPHLEGRFSAPPEPPRLPAPTARACAPDRPRSR
jgi:DNA-binding GntR family transcriptional regulator